MGNRVGVIFHENWNCFSPLLYSHWGAEYIPWKIQEYVKDYYVEHQHGLNGHDGHKFNASHMMLGFVQTLDKDIHMRVENLSDEDIKNIIEKRELENNFDGGCWLVNIAPDHYGDISGDGIYFGHYLKNDNMLNEFERECNYY